MKSNPKRETTSLYPIMKMINLKNLSLGPMMMTRANNHQKTTRKPRNRERSKRKRRKFKKDPLKREKLRPLSKRKK